MASSSTGLMWSWVIWTNNNWRNIKLVKPIWSLVRSTPEFTFGTGKNGNGGGYWAILELIFKQVSDIDLWQKRCQPQTAAIGKGPALLMTDVIALSLNYFFSFIQEFEYHPTDMDDNFAKPHNLSILLYSRYRKVRNTKRKLQTLPLYSQPTISSSNKKFSATLKLQLQQWDPN